MSFYAIVHSVATSVIFSYRIHFIWKKNSTEKRAWWPFVRTPPKLAPKFFPKACQFSVWKAKI